MSPLGLPLERVSDPASSDRGSGSTTGPSTPLVSVIVPFKDAAPFFRETLDSVLAQTWTDLDVVLVDDGGSDSSEAIAREVAAAFPGRVRVVAHEGRVNRGTGPSRALGIRQARGDLVAFLDADDVWEPTHLEDDVRLLLGSPGADMVCGRAWSWHSWADPDAQDSLSGLAFAPGAVVPGTRLVAAVLRNGNVATPTCSLVVRRDVLLGCTDHLEAFPDLYEDQVVNVWLQLRVSTVMSGGAGAWYRQHETSISARHARDPADPARARLAFLTWLRSELTAVDVQDRGLADLTAAALFQAQDRVAGPPGIRGALRQLIPSTVLRRPAARWVQARLTRDSEQARRTRIERLLHRHGEDVRGDVLLVGEAAQHVTQEARVISLQTMREPLDSRALGPHHALAPAPSRSYDCIVLVARSRADVPEIPGLRHLHRALRPAGVLLLVLRRRDLATEQALREVFGWDSVTVDLQGHPGPGDRPHVLLRSAIPAV